MERDVFFKKMEDGYEAALELSGRFRDWESYSMSTRASFKSSREPLRIWRQL